MFSLLKHYAINSAAVCHFDERNKQELQTRARIPYLTELVQLSWTKTWTRAMRPQNTCGKQAKRDESARRDKMKDSAGEKTHVRWGNICDT